MLNERKSAINNLTNSLLFYGTSIFCYHGEGDFATTRRNIKKPMRKHRLFLFQDYSLHLILFIGAHDLRFRIQDSGFGTTHSWVENKL